MGVFDDDCGIIFLVGVFDDDCGIIFLVSH